MTKIKWGRKLSGFKFQIPFADNCNHYINIYSKYQPHISRKSCNLWTRHYCGMSADAEPVVTNYNLTPT